MLKVVILCGGSGTRLWPLSRENFPKQFNKILGDNSLFQETLLRNNPLTTLYPKTQIEIISNAQYYFLLQEQSKEVQQNISTFILESLPKNTAAAIAFSAFNAKEDDTLLILPSDHLITNTQIYLQHIQQAIEIAKKGYLITFGITPSSPHTGYGYIQSNEGEVKQFVEKPDLELAKNYLAQGNYFWNSGMFCFQAGVFLEELKTYANPIYETAKHAFIAATKKDNALFIPLDQSEKIPSDSIDYAILEKSKKVYCLQSNFDWNDVGSFDSLSEEFLTPNSPYQNTTKLVAQESNNNFILSKKLVATIGVEDLIVIDTPDSLLISKKGSSQKVKDILPQIKAFDPSLTQFHQITHRPWGTYQVLLETPTYKIKQICVKPQKRLSLQKHLHRNEHWIVASGTASITLENSTFTLEHNQSTYIPMGKLHRLANLTQEDLIVIEIQMGSYLGEDDIIRVEDDFSRC